MSSVNECAFCTPEQLDWRTITSDSFMRSFVSNPQFRPEQCLVIPNRHITEVGQLMQAEGAAIMHELGRLSTLLDRGFGTGIMQKFQPLQPDNGIKVSHLHFHVFPRIEEEVGLFPVPVPNTFEGFVQAAEEDIVNFAESLR